MKPPDRPATVSKPGFLRKTQRGRRTLIVGDPPVGASEHLVGLALFAFSTLITWAYYGERNMVYLFGRGGVLPYRLIFIAVIFIGALVGSSESPLSPVWLFADVMNGLMALPNLIGLLFLAGVVWRETHDYFIRTGGVLEAELEPGDDGRSRRAR